MRLSGWCFIYFLVTISKVIFPMYMMVFMSNRLWTSFRFLLRNILVTLKDSWYFSTSSHFLLNSTRWQKIAYLRLDDLRDVFDLGSMESLKPQLDKKFKILEKWQNFIAKFSIFFLGKWDSSRYFRIWFSSAINKSIHVHSSSSSLSPFFFVL